MNNFVMDMDINSMYAWSPLIVKQSEIVKLLKKLRYGSHTSKIQLKRRMRLYKGAWIEYDTTKKKDWTKKHIGRMELSSNPVTELKVSFDFEAFKKESNG